MILCIFIDTLKPMMCPSLRLLLPLAFDSGRTFLIKYFFNKTDKR